jgi:two-component system cell cycle sensor histidine kinase/response regulator CckA
MYVIHDLRLALLVLSRGLTSLRKQPLTEPLARDVDALGRLLDSAIAMADDILVRPELQTPITPIDVNEAIAVNCDVIQGIVGSEVRIVTTLGKGDCRVYARPIDLDRILLNVVANAAAAMPNGGLMVIETTAVRTPSHHVDRVMASPFGHLRLTIADTGPGMTARDLWQVREGEQVAGSDGSGVGLSAVSQILLRLGGEIELNTRQQSGTVVSITLPLAAPAHDHVH